MDTELIDLYKKFDSIKKMGWIKSLRKGYSGIGYTFETLIGKEEDNFPIPDYDKYEIKTMRIFSKRVVHLFTIVPDGDFLYPMQRVLDILGYPDKNNNKYRIFNIDFNCLDYKQIGYYRKGIISINRDKKKIELIARDHLNNNLNVDTSWSFKMLEERLYLKLKKLIIIDAYVKKIENQEYFRYQRFHYFILKDFDSFIDAIEKGYIKIGFKIGYIKEGKNKGQLKSRGTVFSIEFVNLEKIYKKVPLNLFEYQLL